METKQNPTNQETRSKVYAILAEHFPLGSSEMLSKCTDAIIEDVNLSISTEKVRLRNALLLKTLLVDTDLSVRALCILRAKEVVTLADLVLYNREDLLKFRNMGKKTMEELDQLLATFGLSFGMDRA